MSWLFGCATNYDYNTRFLLAALQIRDILAKESPAEVEAALSRVSSDLSLAYEDMLSRISSQWLKFLHWVFFANKPLTLKQLRFAWAIKQDTIDLNPTKDLPFSHFINETLGLLVVDREFNTVRFAHSTIKDYLKKHTGKYFPDGQSLLARTCLTFLNFHALSNEPDHARFGSGGDLSPFFEYAAFQWGHHAREAGDDDETCNMAVKWLLSKRMPQVHSVRQKLQMYHWLSYVQPPSPLCEACYFGLRSHVTKLLESGQDVNALDSNGIGPLYSAVWHNHLPVVRVLFSECQNLDVNVQTSDGVTPLHAASRQGHVDIVRYLLMSSLASALEVNLQDRNGWTALIGAAKSGYTDIVDLLLQHPNIDPNVRDNYGWTALTRAVDGGHAATVRSLLRSKDIDLALSRVGEVEFWESVLDSESEVFAKGKYMSLPDDLHVQLGLATRDGN
jgi:ankyrin repeat protein